MTNCIISLKVESELKAQASQVADRLGIPLATYLKMCLKKLTQEQGLDFRLPQTPKNTVHKRWKQQQDDLSKGKNVSQTFSDIHTLKQSLTAPD